MTSIIIPVWNQWDYTAQCLVSIFSHTAPGSYEVIIINNGSTDETIDRLSEMQPTQNCQLSVITNPHNLGVAAAWNQGLKAAKGREMCICNNDILVYPGWLDELLKIEAWCVTPRYVSGQQDADAFYEDQIKNYNGPPAVSAMIHGWCFLLRRQGLEAMHQLERDNGWEVANATGIALFDEQFQYAHFEEVDFNNRLNRAGQQCLEVQKAFVYHFGSKTLLPNLGFLQPHINANAERYMKKWNVDHV